MTDRRDSGASRWSVVGKELSRVQQDPQQLLKALHGAADLIQVRRTALCLGCGRWPANRSQERLLDEPCLLALRALRQPGANFVEPASFAVDRRQNFLVVLGVNRLEKVGFIGSAAIAIVVARRSSKDRGCVVAIAIATD